MATGRGWLFGLVALMALAVLLTGKRARGEPSTAAVLFIDENAGSDVQGCGTNSTNACASVAGALEYNNVTTTRNDTLFGLSVAAGVYTGPSNRNISLPSNVISISGADSTNPKAMTYFQSEVFNETVVFNSTYSYNVTQAAPIFNITSSISLFNLVFSGQFAGQNPNPAVLFLTLDSDVKVTMTNLSFSDVSPAIPIQASLSAGSTLILEDTQTNNPTLITALTSVTTCPSLDYDFPVLIIDNLMVEPAVNIDVFKSNSLITVGLVNLTLSNSYFVNVALGYIVSEQYGQTGCLDTQLSPQTITNVIVSESTTSGLSLSQATVSNVKFINNQIFGFGSLIDFVQGSLSNVSIVGNTWAGLPYMMFPQSGLISTGWAAGSCYYNAVGCGQIPNTLPSVATLQNVVVENNVNLTALSFSWDSGNNPKPNNPFTVALAKVYIDESSISNNTIAYQGSVFITSIIQARTTVTVWDPSNPTGLVYNNNTFLTELVISHSDISHNKAGGGGAIYLAGTSLSLINTTVSHNVADFKDIDPSQADLGVSPPSCNSEYFGGGAIFAEYYSLIKLSQSSVIGDNKVNSPTTTSKLDDDNFKLMAGGVLCCSSGLNVSIQVDKSSSIADNSADMINDLSCRNSTWHKDVPICNVIGETPSTCEYGPGRSGPVILLSVGLVFVFIIVLVLVIGFIRAKRRQAYENIN